MGRGQVDVVVDAQSKPLVLHENSLVSSAWSVVVGCGRELGLVLLVVAGCAWVFDLGIGGSVS